MTLRNKYKVLIIGLGNIGLKYDLKNESTQKILTHSKAFFYHKNFELVAGVDFNQKNRNEFESKYKLKSFRNIEEASSKINPEIIVVSTPTNQHLNNIDLILKLFTPKIIICEKPLSFKIIEAKKIIELCEIKKVRIYINYFRRILPGYLKVLSHIKSNKFKAPFKGVCFYSKGLFNSSSHFINLFQFLFGRVVNIKLINKNKLKEDPEPDFNLEFEGGNITFISNQNNPIFINQTEIIMQNGKLTFDNGGSEIYWRSAKKDNRFKGYNILSKSSKVFYNDFDKIQLYFTDQINLALNEQDNFLCTGVEAMETQNVLEKIKLKL